MTEDLKNRTFESLLAEKLGRIPDSIDKREGAVMYDQLAAGSYEQAAFYRRLQQFYTDTFAKTASGVFLGMRTEEAGIVRKAAAKALRRGVFMADDVPAPVSPGAKFSTLDGADSLVYTVTEKLAAGEYALECDTPGRIGNEYIGAMQHMPGADHYYGSAVLTDILRGGEDEETDEALYARYLAALRSTPFGGNFADYKNTIRGYSYVGGVQLYPAWAGGGTIKAVFLDAGYGVPDVQSVAALQQAICPLERGEGEGWSPIGHRCIVTAPTAVPIHVAATVALSPGASAAAVQAEAVRRLDAYLLGLRKGWDTELTANRASYHLSVRWAQLFVELMGIPGVANLTDFTLNGQSGDLTLTQNHAIQQVPVLGEVVLHVQ